MFFWVVSNFTRIHGKRSSLTSLSLSLSLLCSFGLHKWFGKVYYLTPCLVTPESIGEKSIMHIVYDYDPQFAPIQSPLCNAIGCVNLFYKAWASLLLLGTTDGNQFSFLMFSDGRSLIVHLHLCQCQI